MALDAAQVRVAGTGEVYYAPEGSTAPTDATTVLDAAYKGTGYTTTDGVSFTLSRDTTDLDAWQASRIRILTNSEPVTIGFSLMETTGDNLVLAFGGGTAAAGKFTPPNEGENAIRAMVVEFSDGGFSYRYFFPRVQVQGDLSFALTRTDAVAYELEFGLLAPGAGDDRFAIFTDDPAIPQV